MNLSLTDTLALKALVSYRLADKTRSSSSQAIYAYLRRNPYGNDELGLG